MKNPNLTYVESEAFEELLNRAKVLMAVLIASDDDTLGPDDASSRDVVKLTWSSMSLTASLAGLIMRAQDEPDNAQLRQDLAVTGVMMDEVFAKLSIVAAVDAAEAEANNPTELG